MSTQPARPTQPTQPSFPDVARVDAHDKVRGTLRYVADDVRPEIAHAMLAVATIARGRVIRIETAAARKLPGVLLVLTHDDLADLKSGGYLFHEGYGAHGVQPMTGPQIVCRGQPIALVVAETLETAIEGASLIRATYEAEPHAVTLDAAGSETVSQAEALPVPMFADRVAGDTDSALASADVIVDGTYEAPPQHQNPIELLSTVAEWRDGNLTVHDPTQNAAAVRHGLAVALGLPPERVRAISTSVGGGFGQKNCMQMHTPLVAIAARRVGRPVKLVMPRAQIFHNASFRPATRHRIRLGATHMGQIVAAVHDVDQQTSRQDLFPVMAADVTARLYAIPNFRGHARLVRTDVQTPGFMRAPWEHTATFAFESAIDELAYALGKDPVALRIAHDATHDPLSGRPFSSRHVVECLQRGAKRFGWSRRSPSPASMRAVDGMSIGMGVAIGAYPAASVPEIARLRVSDDGTVSLAIGGHEMGQGLRNVLTALLTSKLGVPSDRITLALGDTDAAPQHVTAGSWGTASAVPAVTQAADELLTKLRRLSKNGAPAQTPDRVLREAGQRSLEVEVHRLPQGMTDAVLGRLRSGLLAIAGPEYPEFVSFSFVAHFVEVHVEPSTRRVRVPRVVSVADCGRVISPRTARSQLRGGVVWGIGATLREATEVDPRFGGFVNTDLAEYVVPVNADIGDIDVDFINEPDPHLNDVGVKGLGEVAMVGVSAAIANAVYHATGRRLRRLPIRLEDLL